MSSPEKSKTFLIIRLSSFGDVLLATSTVRSIKERFPNSTIHFIVKRAFSVMISNNPRIDQIFHYEDIEKDHSLLRHHYEHVLDLQNNPRSHRLINHIKADHIDRYSKNRISRFLHVQFGYSGFNREMKSVPEKYLATLISYYSDLQDFGPEFYIEHPSIEPWKLQKKRYVVAAPGAAHFTKQWPVSKYVALLKNISESGYHIVLLGGPTEKETAKIITDEVGEVTNLVGETSFDESAAIINKSEIVVCNDSSIMHLAAALKKKVLVFFGSTTEIFGFYPYTTDYIVMENKDITCRPCSHIGRKHCPRYHFDCMEGISVESAFDAFQRLLENRS